MHQKAFKKWIKKVYSLQYIPTSIIALKEMSWYPKKWTFLVLNFHLQCEGSKCRYYSAFLLLLPIQSQNVSQSRLKTHNWWYDFSSFWMPATTTIFLFFHCTAWIIQLLALFSFSCAGNCFWRSDSWSSGPLETDDDMYIQII